MADRSKRPREMENGSDDEGLGSKEVNRERGLREKSKKDNMLCYKCNEAWEGYCVICQVFALLF
jgi:hypothetical protein